MKIERTLADALIRKHPERAAIALELVDVEQAAMLLAQHKAEDLAPVLVRMTPRHATSVLDLLSDDKMAAVVEVLPVNVAARLVRRLPEERASAALARMGRLQARGLEALLRFPEGCAGALMDPNVLALRESLTAREALEKIREAPENARYNVYVLDAEQRLAGVVNLRELMLARPSVRLADFMTREPQRLEAHEDQSVVVTHPGWREVHALPVVDEQGGYLGAIRFRTLRALEHELFAQRREDADAREALGQLLSAGAGALVDALSASTPSSRRA